MSGPTHFFASQQLDLFLCFQLSAALYALAFAVTCVRPQWGRYVVALGLMSHTVGMVWRGVLIEFFPLTNKMESFSGAAWSVALVLVLAWHVHRAYLLTLLGLLCALFGATFLFSFDLGWPPPLMRTVWYPLHVPLSFLAYALWMAAAAGAVAWFCDRDPAWLQRIDRFALRGFALWSVGMICGGFWGVVAWGAYFLWDPKVLWSVILWFFYATFAHVHLTPSLQKRPWVRPALALVGLVFVFIAYVGTSFLFGRSSHAFG